MDAKKKTVYAAEQRTPAVRAARKFFRELIRRYCATRLIFLDEFGCNTAMSRRYAWAPKGKKAIGYAPLNYGENVSVVAAMGLNGMTASMQIEGAISGEVFLEYVRQVLVPTLRPGDVVVMDNLPVHKVDGVAQAIHDAGAKILYLPSYSPDFNPIELCFSKIKDFLRKISARTKEGLEQALTQAFQSITLSDIRGWFKHAGYALLSGLPF